MSSFPSCPVCHQQFSLKGPAPLLLPCLHSACETCVTSADGGVLVCGRCERDVNLTETPLQKDEVREKQIRYLSIQKQPELVLCTHEEDGNQAVCWCKDCDDFLCENCQMVHNSFKGTKMHTVQDIGDMELGDLMKDRYCPVHPKFPIDSWDKDCSMLTCGKCRLGDHAGHKVVDVEVAAETARKEIAAFDKEINSIDDKHTANLAAAKNDLQSSIEKISILDGKIGLDFNSLKVLLDQREKELKIELQTQEANIRDQFNAEMKTSETCHQRCQTTSDFIQQTLKYSSLYDILELRQMLEKTSQDCRRSAPTDDYKSLPLSVFNTDGLDRIKATLAHFGTIATEDAVATSQMKDNGTQTEEDLVQELERLAQENKKLKACQKKIIKQEQEVEAFSGLYRLHTQAKKESFLLNCTNVKFSMTKYNAEWVHINTEGKLINKRQPNPPQSDQRLKKYEGTSSTAPLPQCGSPQYFEVESQVDIEKTLPENHLLLEIGLAREEEQDQHHCINRHPHSYSLNVSHCATHSSICRSVWRHGKYLTCLSDTLVNTPGTSATLHYGVVYDSARSRIAFLDVKNEKILEKIDNVDSSVALWSMFGVYNPHWVTVSMSLVVGSDVNMTDKKKGLITDCLS